MDLSCGYESVAREWLEGRGRREAASSAIGVNVVRRWARSLPRGGSVIDLGCGSGFPLTAVLVEEGLEVCAVDASPTLVAAFRANLPGVPVVCESVLESKFFGRTFDAVLAVGLMFLLTPEEQGGLICRIAEALVPGGHLLFTAPAQAHVWADLMTGRESISLGAEEYGRQLTAAGLSVTGEWVDEGESHYIEASREADAKRGRRGT